MGQGFWQLESINSAGHSSNELPSPVHLCFFVFRSEKPGRDLQLPSVSWYRVALLATVPEEDQTKSSIRPESRDSGSSFSKKKEKKKIQAISFFGSCLLFSISVLTHLPNLVP